MNSIRRAFARLAVIVCALRATTNKFSVTALLILGGLFISSLVHADDYYFDTSQKAHDACVARAQSDGSNFSCSFGGSIPNTSNGVYDEYLGCGGTGGITNCDPVLESRFLYPPSCPSGTHFVSPGVCQTPTDNNGCHGAPRAAPDVDSGQPDVASGLRGNPCDAGSGNKVQRETDLLGNVSLSRYYNSQFKQDLGLGLGWNSSVGAHLEVSTSQIVVRAPDGHGQLFLNNGLSQWSGDPNAHISLTQDSAGFLLTYQNDGTKERFDLSGHLYKHHRPQWARDDLQL